MMTREGMLAKEDNSATVHSSLSTRRGAWCNTALTGSQTLLPRMTEPPGLHKVYLSLR